MINYKLGSMVFCLILATGVSAMAAPKKSVPKSKGITLTLDCKTITAASGNGPFPEANATLSQDDLKSGFVLTGGGCLATRATTNRFYKTQPSADGNSWSCQAGDFPGTREDSTITAYARACRVTSK